MEAKDKDGHRQRQSESAKGNESRSRKFSVPTDYSRATWIFSMKKNIFSFSFSFSAQLFFFSFLSPLLHFLPTILPENYCVLPEYHKCVFPPLTLIVGPTN